MVSDTTVTNKSTKRPQDPTNRRTPSNGPAEAKGARAERERRKLRGPLLREQCKVPLRETSRSLQPRQKDPTIPCIRKMLTPVRVSRARRRLTTPELKGGVIILEKAPEQRGQCEAGAPHQAKVTARSPSNAWKKRENAKHKQGATATVESNHQGAGAAAQPKAEG